MKKTIQIGLAAALMSCSFASLGADDPTHIPGIFLGATHIDSETEFTWGIEYEFKFNPKWGVGFVYEETPDGHKGDGVDVKVASVFYHPSKYVRLGAGFGKEKIKGAHPHTENLYRLSASYDFHVGEFGIAPTLAVDFIDDKEAVVFGIAIVRPF